MLNYLNYFFPNFQDARGAIVATDCSVNLGNHHNNFPVLLWNVSAKTFNFFILNNYGLYFLNILSVRVILSKYIKFAHNYTFLWKICMGCICIATFKLEIAITNFLFEKFSMCSKNAIITFYSKYCIIGI
jgi:hypothetical protein